MIWEEYNNEKKANHKKRAQSEFVNISKKLKKTKIMGIIGN